MYRRCLWCGKEYKVGKKGNFNLFGHRDGDVNRKPCTGRVKALAQGAVLPPTWEAKKDARMALEAENEASKSGKHGTLDSFLNVPKFSVALLNMIMVLWLLRNSIPWLRMEDPYLQAAFLLCNPAATLWSASWSARKAMEYFEEFHGKLIRTLQVSSLYFFGSKDMVDISFFLIIAFELDRLGCFIKNMRHS